MNTVRLPIAVLALQLLAVPAAGAADMLFIGGQGDDVGVSAVAWRTREWKAWASASDRWRYSLAGEWQFGKWKAQEAAAKHSSILDSSFTSVFTMRPQASVWSATYVELGFGVHVISHQSINQDRGFGTWFQFGEFAGVGTHLGAEDRYSLGVRIQHVSNGRIKVPNDGVTFVQAVVRYDF
jgi:hypothetical protein